MNKISAIIPVYGESDTANSCIRSLLGQTVHDIEIILVTSDLTDKTPFVAKEYPIEIVDLKGEFTASKARNRGAKGASGDILVFIDADIVLERDSIQKTLDFITGTKVDAVSASYTDNVQGFNFCSRFQTFFLNYRHSFIPRDKNVNFIFSSFFAIKKKVFDEAGGFDEELDAYEDVELGYRLAQEGYSCRLDADNRVTHLKRYTHLGLLKDYFAKAKAAGRFFCKSRFFRKSLAIGNMPGSLKLASVSALAVLFSFAFIGFSALPLLFSLASYLVFISPLLLFLAKKHDLPFCLRSPFLCFEIFIACYLGLAWGILHRKK